MKKLILLTLTALTLMACADNGVSAPGADEPSKNNNGNCVDFVVTLEDVKFGDYQEYYKEWENQACTYRDTEGACLNSDMDKKAVIHDCF